jgi:hypothetical protein
MAAWIAEIDLQTSVEPQLDVLGHLDALVPGQGPPQLFREGCDRAGDRVTHGRGTGTRARRAAPRSRALHAFERWEMQQHREPA